MVFAKHRDCKALNEELSALFVDRSGDPRYANPEPFTHRNPALFESNFRLFDWPQACVQRLREFCLSRLYRAIGELSAYDTAMLQKLHIATESWFHVTRPGGYFGPHNHPMHSWSGVYCVRHEGDDEDSDSGHLTMINPHSMNTMFLDMANAKLSGMYHMGNRKLRLHAGDLVLFPSWLLHEVLPYEGSDVRITVAFNARFRLEGAEPANVPIG